MKKKIDVIRAWRDEEYRNSLAPEELASLPENPAGLSVVDDSVLRSITGGCASTITAYCDPPSSTPNQSCVKPPEICP